jgi:hypothetical protein
MNQNKKVLSKKAYEKANKRNILISLYYKTISTVVKRGIDLKSLNFLLESQNL